MEKFEVWMNDGEEGKAKLVGTYEAESFREACYSAVASGDLSIVDFNVISLTYFHRPLVNNEEAAKKRHMFCLMPSKNKPFINDKESREKCGPLKYLGRSYILYNRTGILDDADWYNNPRGWVVCRVVEMDGDCLYAKPNNIDGDVNAKPAGHYIIDINSNEFFDNALKEYGYDREDFQRQIEVENKRIAYTEDFKKYLAKRKEEGTLNIKG